MAVNDGSVQWELIKISNAEQLSGYDLASLKSYIAGSVSVPVKGVVVTSGSATVYSSSSFTIPLPSGYIRKQCKYVAWFNDHLYEEASSFYGQLMDINQSTGVVRAAFDGGSKCFIDYLCIAIK